MARARDKDHPLVKANEDRAAAGGRDKDTKAAKVAADATDKPADQQTQDVDDLLADETTRMEAVPGPGEDATQPAAKLPDSVEAEQEEWERAVTARPGSGAPVAQRAADQIATADVDAGKIVTEAAPSAGRNVREEPLALVRDVDAADVDTVRMDQRVAGDPDAKPGPTAEPTTEKHAPGAPWPAPGQSLASAPTASPEPGPEPEVQYEPPQAGIRYEHKPEAAVGVIGLPPQEQDERLAAEARDRDATLAARGGQNVEEANREGVAKVGEANRQTIGTFAPMPDDGVPRDEARQVKIDHLSDAAIKAVGAIFQGIPDDPQPHRIRIALENAARRVNSSQWWDLKSKYFDAAAS